MRRFITKTKGRISLGRRCLRASGELPAGSETFSRSRQTPHGSCAGGLDPFHDTQRRTNAIEAAQAPDATDEVNQRHDACTHSAGHSSAVFLLRPSERGG